MEWNNLPCVLATSLTAGTKSQSELTPSVVPRGTLIRRWRNSKLLIAWWGAGVRSDGSRRGPPRPAELRAINPHAMHDHPQPAGECHYGLLLTAPLGDARHADLR
jgi:hypothetical protein